MARTRPARDGPNEAGARAESGAQGDDHRIRVVRARCALSDVLERERGSAEEAMRARRTAPTKSLSNVARGFYSKSEV